MSIHTCSYYCDRPECIRAQRDELRQKLEQAEKPKAQRHISYVCPNCHWSLDRQPDHLLDATKKVWVGLDYKQMRNTTLQFYYGALWAERYLREKNNG